MVASTDRESAKYIPFPVHKINDFIWHHEKRYPWNRLENDVEGCDLNARSAFAFLLGICRRNGISFFCHFRTTFAMYYVPSIMAHVSNYAMAFFFNCNHRNGCNDASRISHRFMVRPFRFRRIQWKWAAVNNCNSCPRACVPTRVAPRLSTLPSKEMLHFRRTLLLHFTSLLISQTKKLKKVRACTSYTYYIWPVNYHSLLWTW